MASMSSSIIACMNVFLIGIGICFMVVRPISSCYYILYGPLMTLGGYLVVQSLLGLLGICFRSHCLMGLYLVVKLVVILVISLGILRDGITMAKGDVKVESNNSTAEAENAHRLQDYVANKYGWIRIRRCMIKEGFCSVNDAKLLLNQLQEGCCQKPPAQQCGVERSNATEGKMAEAGATLENPDCKAWENERGSKCYYCDACKAGFVDSLRELWQSLVPVIVALHIILIFLFIVGCFVLRDFKGVQSQNQYASLTSQF